MTDMAEPELPAPFHLWELWLALPFPAGKQTSEEKTVPHMATEVCSSCKQSDVEILTLDSYLTKLPDYRPLSSLIIAASYQEAFSSQANQAPWPHDSGSSAALPRGAAESCSLRTWRRAEMGNRLLTLQKAQLLLAHSSYSAEAPGSGFMVLRPMSFRFSSQNPSRTSTAEYLFPKPSHLLTSFKAYQNNLKLTSYLDIFLPHLQVLGTGIPAHLPASTPSLLTILCWQAVVQGVFAPLHSLSYTAAKWARSILPLPNPPVFLQQILPYSLMPVQSLW